MHRLKTSYLLLILAVSLTANCQNKLPQLLLRVDDIGMNHSVNMAVKKLGETGIPFSTSVMFACPWYQEAVDILKQCPQATIGVHLTLNAEWKYYRWGPILGKEAVPSLVDSLGYFFPTVRALAEHHYKLDEVERELKAQIDRAIGTGLKISYVDCHMGAAASTPELLAIVRKLADSYGLGISSFFDEEYKSMWGVPVPEKKQEFMSHVSTLKGDQVHLVELHIAVSTPEMDALVDMNSPIMKSADGKSEVSRHRQTELDMIIDPEFQKQNGKKFRLVNYADVIKEKGLKSMKPSGHY